MLLIITALVAVGFCGAGLAAGKAAKQLKQKVFNSPEEAVKAFIEAVKDKNAADVLAILGPGSGDLIYSGDKVADNQARESVIKMYEENNRIVQAGDKKAVLEFGSDNWPFPIPIIEQNGTWRFDTKQGKEEILDRRIGRNELGAIQACMAYVDAQREYASTVRDKEDGVLEYARKFFSEPGKKDGLYWETKEGEELSPLGIFVANAAKAGYRRGPGGKPSPFQGYYYRILKGQGGNAKGGAFDYVVRGKMIGGFALIAYPAKYGSSGIMTFIVNHNGIVYEKDLGPKTESAARAIKLFNPDEGWRKVE
jgi:hypothetical protein